MLLILWRLRQWSRLVSLDKFTRSCSLLFCSAGKLNRSMTSFTGLSFSRGAIGLSRRGHGCSRNHGLWLTGSVATYVPAAVNGSRYLVDPEMWWNRVVDSDQGALRVFRRAGDSRMSLELMDELRHEWLHMKRAVTLLGEDKFESVDEVRPVWIGIHQPDTEGEANLFVSILPIVDESLAEVILGQGPQATIQGHTFKHCDTKFGEWHNFFVAVKGSIGGLEEDVFWPNWMYHDSRKKMNCRDWGDVGIFLADPTKEDIMSHLKSTKRLQEDRGYRKGWSYYRLKDRWGSDPLSKYDIDV